MFYYQHHIGDFIKDTSNLDDHQLAAYLRMMWIYYTEEKPFADDAEDIAFAVRSDEKTVRLLLRHFFQKVDQHWHHNRCDREISNYHGKSEKARESANARWKNAKAMRTHSERNTDAMVFDANQEPRTNNQEPVIDAAPKGAAKGKRLSSEWGLPKAWGDWTISKFNWTENQVRTEAEKFKDFWIAKPGKDGVKLDWSATWRNWCRNAKVQPDKQNGSLLSGGI